MSRFKPDPTEHPLKPGERVFLGPARKVPHLNDTPGWVTFTSHHSRGRDINTNKLNYDKSRIDWPRTNELVRLWDQN